MSMNMSILAGKINKSKLFNSWENVELWNTQGSEYPGTHLIEKASTKVDPVIGKVIVRGRTKRGFYASVALGIGEDAHQCV